MVHMNIASSSTTVEAAQLSPIDNSPNEIASSAIHDEKSATGIDFGDGVIAYCNDDRKNHISSSSSTYFSSQCKQSSSSMKLQKVSREYSEVTSRYGRAASVSTCTIPCLSPQNSPSCASLVTLPLSCMSVSSSVVSATSSESNSSFNKYTQPPVDSLKANDNPNNSTSKTRCLTINWQQKEPKKSYSVHPVHPSNESFSGDEKLKHYGTSVSTTVCMHQSADGTDRDHSFQSPMSEIQDSFFHPLSHSIPGIQPLECCACQAQTTVSCHGSAVQNPIFHNIPYSNHSLTCIGPNNVAFSHFGDVATFKEQKYVSNVESATPDYPAFPSREVSAGQMSDIGGYSNCESVHSASSLQKNTITNEKNSGVLQCIALICCGIASLIAWQFLIVMIPFIEQHMIEQVGMYTSIGNSILGVYQVGCIAVQLLYMFCFNSMQPTSIIISIFVDVLFCILIPIVLTEVSSTIIKTVLFHVLVLGLGVCAGINTGGTLALASAINTRYIGAFSTGQGICGIIAFVANYVLTNYFFDLSTRIGARHMLWSVFAISAFISLVSVSLLIVALKSSWVNDSLQEYWKEKAKRRRKKCSKGLEGSKVPVTPDAQHRNYADPGSRASRIEMINPAVESCVYAESTPSNSPQKMGMFPANNEKSGIQDDVRISEPDIRLLPTRGWSRMLKDSYPYLICVYVNFVITMNLYPRVGPILWLKVSPTPQDYTIIFGIFCVGDFCGKSFPGVSRWIHYYFTSRNELRNLKSTDNKQAGGFFDAVGSAMMNCFLAFLNISRLIFGFLSSTPAGLLGLVFSRAVYVVFFLVFAFVGDANVNADRMIYYSIVMFFFALSSGLCATLSLENACASVPRFEEKELIAPAAVLMLLLGILTGVYSAYIY